MIQSAVTNIIGPAVTAQAPDGTVNQVILKLNDFFNYWFIFIGG